MARKQKCNYAGILSCVIWLLIQCEKFLDEKIALKIKPSILADSTRHEFAI